MFLMNLFVSVLCDVQVPSAIQMLTVPRRLVLHTSTSSTRSDWSVPSGLCVIIQVQK